MCYQSITDGLAQFEKRFNTRMKKVVERMVGYLRPDWFLEIWRRWKNSSNWVRMLNIWTNIPQKYRQGSCLLMFSFSHFDNSFHFPFVSCVHFSGAHRNQLWQMISTKTDIQCNSWLILVCKTASKYNFVFFSFYILQVEVDFQRVISSARS